MNHNFDKEPKGARGQKSAAKHITHSHISILYLGDLGNNAIFVESVRMVKKFIYFAFFCTVVPLKKIKKIPIYLPQ